MTNKSPVIVAIATAPGRGGVGIVRLSGYKLDIFIDQIISQKLTPRCARFGAFLAADGSVIDEGIALYFPAPNSFTGEEVLELHGHGGPVILDQLLQRCIELGATLARPGEFSERAFLNDKIDLVQAEAIADLIDASSTQAAQSAMRALQGEFSRQIHQLVEQLIVLRIYVEAAIDFPEEEIDFLNDAHVHDSLDAVRKGLTAVQQQAHQGSLLRDGMTVVLAGKPNAGKSSLLNALAGREAAIVTEIAGTTRDLLREQITIDGMPLHIVDTAGLRDSADLVEQEGIRRAWREIETADLVLYLQDATQPLAGLAEQWPELYHHIGNKDKITSLLNKADLMVGRDLVAPPGTLAISAKTGLGLDQLREHLKAVMGFQASGEGVFTARRRHLDALARAAQSLDAGYRQLTEQGAGELLAEDLRDAQRALGEITGEFGADDLLGRIFSSFCIGK